MFICYLTSVFVMFIAGTTDATGAAATGQGVPIAGGVRFGLSQAANLDNSWTFAGHENEHDPQVDTRAPLASRRSFDAERTGFEPADRFPGHRFSKPALSTTQPPLRSDIVDHVLYPILATPTDHRKTSSKLLQR